MRHEKNILYNNTTIDTNIKVIEVITCEKTP